MKRFFLLLCLFTLTLAFATPVLAHRPMWGESLGPTEVDDISISYAFYQTLQQDEIEVFFFEGKAGDKLHAGIQIPDNGRYEDYNVTVALFGPGLKQADPAQLPAEYPEDLGAVIFESEVTEPFFEPFTQTNYLGRQQINLTLPEDGTYYILVWNTNNVTGKYVIDIGYREVFTPLDMLIFPFWWMRVQWYFEAYILASLPVAALLGLFGAAVYRRISRRKNKDLMKTQISPV